MNRPRWSEFGQLRRLLPLLAAALLLVALALPMWRIEMNAVQYPTETLQIGLYAYPRVSGDFVEISRLNHYIGFYYPDPVYWQPNYEPHPQAIDVPEWSFGPLAFVAVAATGVFVALAPTVRKLQLGLNAQLAGSLLVFGGLLADIQYRLYQAGHLLDPGAPVMGVEPFTPPLLGSYSVANITSYSSFGLGAYLSMLAIGLLVIAWLARNSIATPRDVPGILRSLPDRFRDRSGTDEPLQRPDLDEQTTQRPDEQVNR